MLTTERIGEDFTVDSAHNGDARVERIELISQADRTYLSGQLSEHMVNELLAILKLLPPDVREQLVTEVRMEAEGFGDRAVQIGLARLLDRRTSAQESVR